MSGIFLGLLSDRLLNFGGWVRQAQNPDKQTNSRKIKVYILVRVWCAFCSGVVCPIFPDLSSDALQDRIKRGELVSNPTTLRKSN